MYFLSIFFLHFLLLLIFLQNDPPLPAGWTAPGSNTFVNFAYYLLVIKPPVAMGPPEIPMGTHNHFPGFSGILPNFQGFRGFVNFREILWNFGIFRISMNSRNFQKIPFRFVWSKHDLHSQMMILYGKTMILYGQMRFVVTKRVFV